MNCSWDAVMAWKIQSGVDSRTISRLFRATEAEPAWWWLPTCITATSLPGKNVTPPLPEEGPGAAHVWGESQREEEKQGVRRNLHLCEKKTKNRAKQINPNCSSQDRSPHLKMSQRCDGGETRDRRTTTLSGEKDVFDVIIISRKGWVSLNIRGIMRLGLWMLAFSFSF